MYRAAEGLETVRYLKLSGGGWRESRMPAGVADELIRTSVTYRDDGEWLHIDGGLRYDIRDLVAATSM